MTGILTGDIINSRESKTNEWLSVLKKEFNKFGKTPKIWEIFRGDSFQLEVNYTDALRIAYLLKATIKQEQNLDVRIGIGIGNKSYNANKITEANGDAFIFSGKAFEELKRKNLSVKTDNDTLDNLLNIMIDLAALTADNWTPTEAETFKTALENPELNQKELAKLLNKTQSNISAGLKRSGYDEILKLLNYYQQNIATL